ncbi:MAG: PfkB family carbohydrate kinase [Anaerotignum sp.]|nr:PfkB family carbohydrate kinase [Anaerotignum sp.]
MKQTLVIGSAVVDVIVNIPHLPVTGEDVHISKQSRSLGGCAYLTSDILRHFLAPYSLCTAVGGGIYGNFVLQKLKERGVPIYVRRQEKENGCCYCMVEEGGERTFIVDHGIEYTFYEAYLEKLDTQSIDTVYICGLEIEEATGMNIIEYLRKHPEYQIYFSPSPRIMKIQPERMTAVLGLHPIVHLNEKELLEFTAASSVEMGARKLYEKTQNPVIVTLGEKGAYCFDGKEDLYAPPVKATVVDTIGAGDSHMGAVIAARRFGLTFGQAIEAANYISAAVVAKSGGLLEAEDFKNALAKMPESLQQKFSIKV